MDKKDSISPPSSNHPSCSHLLTSFLTRALAHFGPSCDLISLINMAMRYSNFSLQGLVFVFFFPCFLLTELAHRKGSGRASTILRVRREARAGGCTHSIWQQEALDQPTERFETIHFSSNQRVINICNTFRQRDKSLSGIQEAAWWQELRLLEACPQLGDTESRGLPLRAPAFVVVFQ